ncbi:hypothetical protein R1sor_006828 [Riccia sorocarpa]|uniref:Protein NO VEIN C-terminal domain-containing protein n=1 Tax=Riccia sorocarpa TaxID=122646 RepID=A0ABD3HS61_9MARC
MQGGNGNFRSQKWGPIINSMPPESPTFPQEFQASGHLFLTRANGGTVTSPHQTPWEGQSPRGWRGPQQDLQWTPPPPGVSPRTQSHRRMRSGPVQNVQEMYGSPPQGLVNAGGRRLSNSPSTLGTGSPQQSAENGLVLSHDRGRRQVLSPGDSPSFPLWGDGPGRKRNGEQNDKLGVPERLAQRVYSELLAQRKGVSTAKVAQQTLSALGVPSFDAIGVMPNEIPTLRKLSLLEGKVNAFIHSHVAGKKITTLYDLSVDLTRDEGVKEFEELGLGPLLCHPLVGHYFTPPGGAEVHKITAGEVIQLLSDYIGNLGKDTRVQIDNFLGYIQKERGLPSPQHLCIKIQSLGMHIGFIRRAKKAEKELISIWESRARAEFDKKQKPGVFERVQNFLAMAEKKKALGKRKCPFSDTATASEDELEDEDLVEGSSKRAAKLLLKTSSDRKRKEDDSIRLFPLTTTSSCPYPSAAEERARLKKQELRQFVANSEQEDFYLSSMELQEFVTILKDACENRSVHEVLMKMIEMSRKFKGTKKRSGKSKIFKAYPAIGLLNVAVLSVKAGYWDSMYDNFLNVLDDGKEPNKEEEDERLVEIVVPADTSADPKESSPCQVVKAPGSEQIAAAVLEHFDQHSKLRTSEEMQSAQAPQSRAWWTLLHWTSECERWITEKYSVGSFTSLGFGSFPDFLEQNKELLPRQLISLLSGNPVHNRLSVKVPVERVFSFVTQALPAVSENGSVSHDNLLRVLCRQFKIDSVEELGVSSVDSLIETHNEQQSRLTARNHVYFLAPLLGLSPPYQRVEEGCEEGTSTSVSNQIFNQVRVGVLGSMTSADATKSLLKAPYLTDLSRWSQWDQVFAPTLGPLLDWFEREGLKGGLHALVTCEGVLLRIDEKATVESFLLATVSGRGDQMAAALLSLIALYGGTTNTPAALLKSHANKGLEIFLGSNAGEVAGQSLCKPPLTSVKRKYAEHREGQIAKSAFSESKLKSSANPSSAASRCVVECLFRIIPDFRVFAAEILLPALSPLVPSSASILLGSCPSSEHRSVLHAVGLTLGIPEWIADYNLSVTGALLQSSSSLRVNSVDSMDVDDSSSMITNRGELAAGSDALVVVSSGSDTIMVQQELKMVADQPTVGGDGESSPEKPQLKVRIKGRHSSVMKDVSPTSGALCEKSSGESAARMVVEEIRRNEFGIGQDIGGTHGDLLARQHARMGRALHRLSSDLYSQDSHFVLELVQNADDNSYTAGVEAALVFLIQEGRIVVLNNETGFTAMNMRALCDVGNSTKAGSKTGYIGHKGIGFKSVFRVTNSPEIHSNGFHVKFDTSEGDIGFILPTTVPHPPACKPLDDILSLMPKVKVPKNVNEGWNTRIDLPIKTSVYKGGGMSSLASKFSDLHPSLLLFLHRLRCIAVRNEITGSIVVMHREDLGDDLVKVVHEKGTATWMVVRRQLKASVHRPGITGTEIALAFQLTEVSGGVYEACSEQQQVFAFLPLRAYGLRFIVQGDFIVPSSREEVDCDSDWNQWLRTEIPDVFIRSAKSFEKLIATSGNPGKAVSSFMSFVPMEGEVLGFFSPLPRMIMSRLRATACLPIEGGGWALPCMLLRGWSSQTRQILPDSLLKEHLGLCYLDKEVVLSDILASKLGVQSFGAGTLVAVMKSISHKKGILTSLGLSWVEAWLSALHDCFESDQVSHNPAIYEDKYISLKSELQRLPFIPLSNGTFTALGDGPVWFAGEMSGDGLGVSSSLSRFLLLSSELRTVHPSLLAGRANGLGETRKIGSDSSVGKVVSILQKLGVSRISSHEVIKSHILPAMASEDCIKKAPRLVAEYLGFLMSHLETSCNVCQTERLINSQLQRCAVIVTNHGLVRVGQEPIHFGTALGNPFDVTKILEGTGMVWIEVSPLYLQLQAIDDEEVTKWRRFFKELGVTDFVQVLPVEKKFVEKSSSAWSKMPWEGESGNNGGWIVEDWESPELTQILSGAHSANRDSEEKSASASMRLRDRFTNVLLALDRLWDDYYNQYCQAVYRPSTASVSWKTFTVSSFSLQLQRFSWVRSSVDEELHPPSKLFRHCDSVKSVLGVHAPYVGPQIQNENFMEALGLRTQVFVEDALLLLRRLSAGNRQFKASVAQMTRLYTFLWENFPAHKERILSVLRTEASIFIPSNWNRVHEEVQPGKFYPLERVCWSDPTQTLSLITSDPETTVLLPVIPLSNIYHGLHDFFVGECLVQEKPDFDGYLEVLRRIAAEQLPSSVLDKVMEVFYVWSMEIATGKVEPSEIVRWKKLLEEVESCVFPTNQDKWVSLNAQTGLFCICDDESLGEEFKESVGCINFLLLGDDDLVKVCQRSSLHKSTVTLQPLVQALCIPKLSEAVEREVIKYGSHDTTRIEALIGWVLPYVQRYLRHHHVDLYNYLGNSGISEALRRIQFVVVDQLFFQYCLRNSSIRSSRRTPSTCLLQGSTLHVVENFVHDYCNIYVELSRFFFNGRSDLSVANFLHLITLMTSSGSPEREVENFISNIQGIPPIPEGEELWTLGFRTVESSPEQERSTSCGSYLERHVNHQNLRKKVVRGQMSDGWPPHSWKPAPTDEGVMPSPERIPHETSGDIVSSPGEVRCPTTEAMNGYSLRNYAAYGGSQDQEGRDIEFESGGGLGMHKSGWDGVARNVLAERGNDAGHGFEVPQAGSHRWPSYQEEKIDGSKFSGNMTGDWEMPRRNLPQLQIQIQPDAAQFMDSRSAPLDVQELLVDGYDPMLFENGVMSSTLQNFQGRDYLAMNPLSEQQREVTGRSGEALVFQYLVKNYGPSNVKWINQEGESGAAYDIVIYKDSGQQEYVEVKATRSGDKDWFEISPREWDFAGQHGEYFTIIRVFFGPSNQQVKLLRLPNPVKLAQDHIIQLALLLPATQGNSLVDVKALPASPDGHPVPLRH